MALAKGISLILQLAPTIAIVVIAVWNPFKNTKLTALAYLLYVVWAIPTLWKLAHM